MLFLFRILHICSCICTLFMTSLVDLYMLYRILLSISVKLVLCRNGHISRNNSKTEGLIKSVIDYVISVIYYCLKWINKNYL